MKLEREERMVDFEWSILKCNENANFRVDSQKGKLLVCSDSYVFVKRPEIDAISMS